MARQCEQLYSSANDEVTEVVEATSCYNCERTMVVSGVDEAACCHACHEPISGSADDVAIEGPMHRPTAGVVIASS